MKTPAPPEVFAALASCAPTLLLLFMLVGLALLAPPRPVARAAEAAKLDTLRLDYAYYNPVSLVLRDQGLLEKEFAADGTRVEWVLSLGSNKALEFLRAKAVDFGSTAGAAALIGRANGNPIKSVYLYSNPEWTALVTRPDRGSRPSRTSGAKRLPSPVAPTRTSSSCAPWPARA